MRRHPQKITASVILKDVLGFSSKAFSMELNFMDLLLWASAS